jgi:hypothetical protein
VRKAKLNTYDLTKQTNNKQQTMKHAAAVAYEKEKEKKKEG